MMECDIPPSCMPCCGGGKFPGSAAPGKPPLCCNCCSIPRLRLAMWLEKGLHLRCLRPPCPLQPVAPTRTAALCVARAQVEDAAWKYLLGGIDTFWMGGTLNAGAAFDGWGLNDIAVICCMIAAWLANSWLMAAVTSEQNFCIRGGCVRAPNRTTSGFCRCCLCDHSGVIVGIVIALLVQNILYIFCCTYPCWPAVLRKWMNVRHLEYASWMNVFKIGYNLTGMASHVSHFINGKIPDCIRRRTALPMTCFGMYGSWAIVWNSWHCSIWYKSISGGLVAGNGLRNNTLLWNNDIVLGLS